MFRPRFPSRGILRAGAALAAAAAVATTTANATRPNPHHGTHEHACRIPGAREPINRIWRPALGAAIDYARTRTGDIAFAVRTQGRFYGYRPDHVEWSASVVKAMLMVAYLDRRSVAARPLNGSDFSLLVPMITHSDNNAAGSVRDIVGNGGLQALANRVGMTNFLPIAQPWGETHITARDQTSFFLHIDRYTAARHRAFAMRQLASITPAQRWGIGAVAPAGWHLYFKGGWGSGTGLLDHQAVLLKRGCARVSLAVLTMNDGSHAYGKATLRGLFARLLRRFPTGAPLYPVVRGARYGGPILGDPTSGRSEPATSTADGVGFRTTGGGQHLRRFQIVYANDPSDRCTDTGRLALADIAVDPWGRFSARLRNPAARTTLTGRFLRRRAAAGVLLVTETEPVTGAATCTFRAGWRARAGGR